MCHLCSLRSWLCPNNPRIESSSGFKLKTCTQSRSLCRTASAICLSRCMCVLAARCSVLSIVLCVITAVRWTCRKSWRATHNRFHEEVQCSTRRGARIFFLHFGSYLRNQVSYDHVAGTIMILSPYWTPWFIWLRVTWRRRVTTWRRGVSHPLEWQF